MGKIRGLSTPRSGGWAESEIGGTGMGMVAAAHEAAAHEKRTRQMTDAKRHAIERTPGYWPGCELGVYRINRAGNALNIAKNRLFVPISSQNGTTGGIGQIISSIVTNLACNFLRIGQVKVNFVPERAMGMDAVRLRHLCP